MKYVLIEKNIQKIEKNGNYILSFEGSGYRLVINTTSSEIFDVLDNYETVAELLNYMGTLYTDIDRRVLEKDLKEILRLFEVYGIIKIEDEVRGTSDNSNCKYIVNGDVSYSKVSEFVQRSLSDEDSVSFGQGDSQYYSPIVMRQRVMNGHEIGVFADYSNKVKSYMSFAINPFQSSKTLVINDVFFDTGLSEEDMIMYFRGMINRVFRIVAATRNISKIRLVSYGDLCSETVLRILELTGFEVECVLKDETLDGDMTFYVSFAQ